MARRRTSPGAARGLSDRLAAWFAGARRDLPWRRERSAYRTWLSEIMLQQTRVSVVEGYFTRFVARFPDVHALAAAHEDEVLSLWSGLGYYTRGRNLHRAAKAVVELHGGKLPRTADALRTLPGVGDYTASAVASIAFGERTAVVDGNVARVLARLHADATPVDSPAGRAALTARAQELCEASDEPGAHNEAMMELGALVCTPKAPTCGACPWRRDCAAHADGAVLAYPVKSPKRPRKRMWVACLVMVAGERVWLEKREGRGLFGGLYEPPAREVSTEDDAASAWRALADERGVSAPSSWPRPLVVERTLTHRDLAFLCARVDVEPGDARAGERFVAREDIARLGTSTAVRAVLEAAWPAQPRLLMNS